MHVMNLKKKIFKVKSLRSKFSTEIIHKHLLSHTLYILVCLYQRKMHMKYCLYRQKYNQRPAKVSYSLFVIVIKNAKIIVTH